MAALTVYWWCLDATCDETGTGDGGRAKGTPARHTEDTGHGTTTSIKPRPEGWGE